MKRAPVLGLLLAANAVFADAPAWVAKSNQNAQILLEANSRFSPESGAQYGLAGLDDQILDHKPKIGERYASALDDARRTLTAKLKQERDPLVKQDLEIMIDSARDDVRNYELRRKYFLPYYNLPRSIYNGLSSLLDEQVDTKRRPAALVRLRKYTGLESGYTPLTTLAEDRIRERLRDTKLLGPSKVEVEKDLSNTTFFLDGIEQLFQKYKIDGYQEPFARLKEQLTGYGEFVKKEILPRTRLDFRLPKEYYDFSLTQYGVDIPSAELVSIAHTAFNQIQDEMATVAAQLAAQKGWSFRNYREVIRELKKDQLVGEQILPHYQARIKSIEEIVRREKLVTVPVRPARMSIASAAETAAQPAPHMRPPRLIGNTGESGEFILPLNIPGPAGGLRYDDFSFEAASWTLTSHEARPGHEMQFAALVENGVSQARAIFAFNSTNVEGWGLYAEYIMRPFMPLDGQLISLQHRLMRAARAYLDPELHMGKITPEQANKILREDVMLSEAMANQEVERYTFRSPAQATSYFYGFTRLVQLRNDVEKAMGPEFDQQKFHDFILAQGLLPPALLRKAVYAEFVH